MVDPMSSDEELGEGQPQKVQSRVAYRLAYEATLDWRDGSYAKLEAFRNRAVGLLSVSVIVMVAGIGVTTGEATTRGWLTWVGVSVAVLGLLLSFVAAVALMRPLTGHFVVSPKALVEDYGDNHETYQTDDDTYKDIALHGEKKYTKLSKDVKRRSDWLYMSMTGLVVTLLGTGLVWVDAF